MIFSVGIDPGLSGAIACLGSEGTCLSLVNMPVRMGSRGKPVVDAFALSVHLRSLHRDWDIFIVLESVHSLPSDSKRGAFSFGRSVGKVQAALEILGKVFIEPSPQEWKGKILKGTTKDKDAAIGYALARWPGVDLKATPKCKKLSSDKAEALCLAEYGLWHLRGKA